MEAEAAEPAQAPAASAGDAPQAGAQPAARPPADAAGAGAPVAAAGASFIPGFFAGPRPGYTWSDEGGLGRCACPPTTTHPTTPHPPFAPAHPPACAHRGYYAYSFSMPHPRTVVVHGPTTAALPDSPAQGSASKKHKAAAATPAATGSAM